MTTYSAPLTWSASKADVGLSYGFSAMVAMYLADNADLAASGILSLIGDLAGSGTDVMRVRNVDGYGWSTRLQSMATETSAPVQVTPAAGYTSLTLGQHGLASSQSFKSAVLSMAEMRDMLGDEAMAANVAATLGATIRYLACVSGSGITASVGSSAVATDLDDYLSAIASFNTTAGAASMGAPVSTLHLQQVQSIINAARTDPAFQNSVSDFGALLRVRGQSIPNFLGLGGDVVATNDVQQSGGAYHGFMISRGGIGWGRAAVSGALNGKLLNPIFIDDLGAVMYQVTDGHNQQVIGTNIVAFLGTALGDSNVYHQTRILGKV